MAEELEWLVAAGERMADLEAEEVEVEDPIPEEVEVVERKTSRCRGCDGQLVGLEMAGRKARRQPPRVPGLVIGQTVLKEIRAWKPQTETRGPMNRMRGYIQVSQQSTAMTRE